MIRWEGPHQEVRFMGDPLEMILTIIVLSFWFLFPIGIFISVSHVDKNTDQVVRLGHLRHYSDEEDEKIKPMKIPAKVGKRPARRPHVTQIHNRRWIRH